MGYTTIPVDENGRGCVYVVLDRQVQGPVIFMNVGTARLEAWEYARKHGINEVMKIFSDTREAVKDIDPMN